MLLAIEVTVLSPVSYGSLQRKVVLGRSDPSNEQYQTLLAKAFTSNLDALANGGMNNV